jgi:hypothetical protein
MLIWVSPQPPPYGVTSKTPDNPRDANEKVSTGEVAVKRVLYTVNDPFVSTVTVKSYCLPTVSPHPTSSGHAERDEFPMTKELLESSSC